MPWAMRWALLLLLVAFPVAGQAQDWPVYGADPGGTRYSGAAQITKENVGRLAVAWVYHRVRRRGAGTPPLPAPPSS